MLNACEFGVPQLRPRFILVAVKRKYFTRWAWPAAEGSPLSVGESLSDLMRAGGWEGAGNSEARSATGIAPTVVGRSKKHGGPDLGPTRARLHWSDWVSTGWESPMGRLAREPPPTSHRS